MRAPNLLNYTGETVHSNRIIYTPSDFARNNLLYLQETGGLTALQVHESHRSELSSYLFFIVLHGKGTLTVDNVEYELKEGDCAFVDCMQNYKHKSSDKLWTLRWAHFNGTTMPGIYDKYRKRGGRYVFSLTDAEDRRKIEDLLGTIHSCAASASYVRDMEINAILATLLTILMSYSWNPEQRENNKNRKDVQQVREYIDKHYAEDIKLDDLAQMLFVTKFYLTKLFKEQYGTKIFDYLAQVRITNAKKHLRFTDLSVEQVGAKCGYSDANYFIRVFKQWEGITPGEFRKQWKA